MNLMKAIIIIFILTTVHSFPQKGTAPNGFNEYLVHYLSQIYEYISNIPAVSNLFTVVGKERVIRKVLFTKVGQLIQSVAIQLLHDPKRDRALGRPYNKYQKKILTDFPCNTTGGRSDVRPSSVHQLRPGDIDLVACFGDSMTRGTGLMATNELQFISSDGDVSMIIGGAKTWREYLTLPNILKEFNPKLMGYASVPTISHPLTEGSLDYNFAEPFASSDDLMAMAKSYTKKLKRDRRVNIQQDWKMLSVFIGAVDMCGYMCHWKKDPLEEHRKTLEQFLDFLMANSPRTIVNILLVPNVLRFLTAQRDVSSFCQMQHRTICHCLFIHNYSRQEKYLEIIDRLSDVQLQVANLPKYQKKEDFAVIAQPIFVKEVFPLRSTPQGYKTDYTFYAPDCCHISQKTHSLAANALWNALLTPPGEKQDSLNHKLMDTFLCPTAERPYIATLRNSRRIETETKSTF